MWQPIETAPKDGSWFLAYDEDSGEMAVVRCFRSWEPDDWQPTHWMPLPDPPSTERE